MNYRNSFLAFLFSLAPFMSLEINAENLEVFLYKEISGYEIKDLVTNDAFPDNYSEMVSIDKLDYSPSLSRYGSFLRGYIVPCAKDQFMAILESEKRVTLHFRFYFNQKEYYHGDIESFPKEAA